VTSKTQDTDNKLFANNRSQTVTTYSQDVDSELIATSSARHRGASARPYAFTEQGVAMLSSVLKSPRAIEVNIAIMRTFVQLRHMMDSNKELARKIEKLEKKYDEHFQTVFSAIQELIKEDDIPKRKIGFQT